MAKYRDSFEQSPFWIRLNEILGVSFGAGRPFGIELRILWLAVILFPLVILFYYEGETAWQTLAAMIVLPLLIGSIIFSHEMGHITAAWRYNIRTPLITISPLGGLAHLDTPAPGPKSELLIALAGPAVHLAWLAVFWPLQYYFGAWQVGDGPWVGFSRYLLHFLVDINLWLMIFNLLPFYPLDGGRVLRSLLAMRLHANRATMVAANIGMFGAALIGVFGLTRGGLWAGVMLALALSCYFTCRQARRAAQWSDGPYGPKREAWEENPDWWKGETQPEAQPKAKSTRREEELQRQRERETRAALDAEVDRILDRISSVGLKGLSAAERVVLKRASKNRRKAE